MYHNSRLPSEFCNYFELNKTCISTIRVEVGHNDLHVAAINKNFGKKKH